MWFPDFCRLSLFLVAGRFRACLRVSLPRLSPRESRICSSSQLTLLCCSQSFPSLLQRPLMLNVTIEAENSKLKVCYSSEIGEKTEIFVEFLVVFFYSSTWHVSVVCLFIFRFSRSRLGFCLSQRFVYTQPGQ